MPNRWYVKKEGETRGPYPAGALVQDRLVGRITNADLVSVDQEEWKPFSEWPELAEAITASPSTAGGSEQDGWVAERNHARARWADQRAGEERRVAEVRGQEADANRRESETDRRAASAPHRRPRSASRAGLSATLPIWALVVALVAVAAIVAVLVSLFGAVNPVTVRLR